MPLVGTVKIKKGRVTGWAAQCKEPRCRFLEGPTTKKKADNAAIMHAMGSHGWTPNVAPLDA